ncbi:hypothetical protein QWM81_04505 [Streptomyces ficellus]|uniref:Tat pathway signal sequence domain protein n=1 Tax=Streptomyces ficellus TaxID=1977088 RepID=A0ABT7Z1I0_9ACTN|nr:hypothetical protein [Streptomyces ficellus]MDN3293320.1 hypothetical protein [Streptomyces ficellus]
MKKRSMLAVASLAVGAAIAALSPAPPAAQAATGDGALNSPDVVGSVESPERDGEEAEDA